MFSVPLHLRVTSLYCYHRLFSCRDVVDEYSKEVYRITIELLGSLSLMMNIDKDRLFRLHGEIKQGMRMNYYPTCSKPNQVLGVSPHSDGSSITILLQDDDITGLQIKHKGEWLPVKPIPNALVVNIGDAIEVHCKFLIFSRVFSFCNANRIHFPPVIARLGAMGCTRALNIGRLRMKRRQERL